MQHHLWLAILVVATVGFSLVFACAAPFAAFGAAAALTLSRRDGLLGTVALWLTNQIAGYLIVGYPWTPNSVAWGPAIGIAAVLGTLTAQWTVRRLAEAGGLVRALAALILAFAVYEVAIFLVSAALLGGVEMFAPPIVGQVFVTNVAALVGLYGLNRLGASLGLRRRAEAPVSA
jgi:hypothetical protein